MGKGILKMIKFRVPPPPPSSSYWTASFLKLSLLSAYVTSFSFSTIIPGFMSHYTTSAYSYTVSLLLIYSPTLHILAIVHYKALTLFGVPDTFLFIFLKNYFSHLHSAISYNFIFIL
jgi:hypothetical protein